MFGQYAWVDDTERAEAGSGIFFAPCLGLSAKHVAKEGFSKLDTRNQRGTAPDPLRPQYRRIEIEQDYACIVYSFPEGGEGQVLWKMKNDWGSHDTDITTILVEPRTLGAEKRLGEMRYLEWQLLPPKIGSTVQLYGLPGQKHQVISYIYHIIYRA